MSLSMKLSCRVFVTVLLETWRSSLSFLKIKTVPFQTLLQILWAF